MKVKDIMTSNPKSVLETASFNEAAKIIALEKFSGLPVTNAAGECVGIISEKDLLQKMFPTYSELMDQDSDVPLYSMDLEKIEDKMNEVSDIKVKDIMSKEIVQVDPQTPIMQAASTMIIYRVRRLPVIEDKKLVGIISQGDVFRSILKKELDFNN